MVFRGIWRELSLANEDQYNTIGEFWDEMAWVYGLENLCGLGYKWEGGKIFYAIGLSVGDIQGYNLCIELPDENWLAVNGKTKSLGTIYDEIYRHCAIRYEIDTFGENGQCQIKYCR